MCKVQGKPTRQFNLSLKQLHVDLYSAGTTASQLIGVDLWPPHIVPDRRHSLCSTALPEISNRIVGKILQRTNWYHILFSSILGCTDIVIWSMAQSGAETKYGVPTLREKWTTALISIQVSLLYIASHVYRCLTNFSPHSSPVHQAGGGTKHAPGIHARLWRTIAEEFVLSSPEKRWGHARESSYTRAVGCTLTYLPSGETTTISNSQVRGLEWKGRFSGSVLCNLFNSGILVYKIHIIFIYIYVYCNCL